eukprot:1492036-Amphidinium_carterae.1
MNNSKVRSHLGCSFVHWGWALEVFGSVFVESFPHQSPAFLSDLSVRLLSICNSDSRWSDPTSSTNQSH